MTKHSVVTYQKWPCLQPPHQQLQLVEMEHINWLDKVTKSWKNVQQCFSQNWHLRGNMTINPSCTGSIVSTCLTVMFVDSVWGQSSGLTVPMLRACRASMHPLWILQQSTSVKDSFVSTPWAGPWLSGPQELTWSENQTRHVSLCVQIMLAWSLASIIISAPANVT
jgi:hypothetical protein